MSFDYFWGFFSAICGYVWCSVKKSLRLGPVNKAATEKDLINKVLDCRCCCSIIVSR